MSEKFYKTSQVYLERILEHALKIKKYKAGLTFEIFNNQNQEYDAICMQLSQIGENVSKIELITITLGSNLKKFGPCSRTISRNLKKEPKKFSKKDSV